MKDTNMENNNLLIAEEVSKILRIPLPTVYRLTQQGKVKAVKIGKRWLYKKEDIDVYLQFGTNFSSTPSKKSSNIQEKTQFVDRSDRRSYPRINSNFQCKYSINLTPFRELSGCGMIKDIGGGGVFVAAKREIDNLCVNDPIDIQFSLANSENSSLLNIFGKIVRKTDNGFALKFKHIDKDVQNNIINYSE